MTLDRRNASVLNLRRKLAGTLKIKASLGHTVMRTLPDIASFTWDIRRSSRVHVLNRS